MNLSVTIPKLNALKDKIAQYPQISEPYVNMAIDRSLVRILGQEKLEAPVDTGNLRDNWTVKMGRFQGSLESNVPYSVFVQTGTRPHFPPVDAIAPWAIKRGIPPFALALAIAKHGTKPNPFMTRAIKTALPGVKTEFQTALGAIIKDIAAI